MFKKIEIIIEHFKTATSAITGALIVYFFKKCLNATEEDSILIALFSAIIAFFVLFIGKLVIDHFIENSYKLRKSIVKSHFIEGCWIQKVSDSSPNRQDNLVRLFVIFEKNILKIHGSSYSLNGDLIGIFTAEYSVYSEFSLKYPFIHKSLVDTDKPFIYGQTELNFQWSGRNPAAYIGVVHSNRKDTGTVVLGRKLNNVDEFNFQNSTHVEFLFNSIK